MPISKRTYNELKRRFGDCASWAIWNDPAPGKSETRDCSEFIGPEAILDNESKVLSSLNDKYMFVGLNPSGEKPKAKQPKWNSFHVTCNDARLRLALKGTRHWGSYLTDFVKGHFDSVSGRVNPNETKTKKAMNDLTRELELLRNVEIIFAMGHKAERFLRSFCESRKNRFPNLKVAYFPHYSMRCSINSYLAKAREALKAAYK